MWLIYNELAMVPAVFLIFAVRGRRNPLHVLTIVGTCLALTIAPICAVAFMILGFRVYLGLLPFMNALIVPVVTVALASRGPLAPANEPARGLAALSIL